MISSFKIFVGKPEGKGPYDRPRCRQEVNKENVLR